ncbi:nef attachable domain protein, partial [Chlamydia psittaci C1/97]
RSFLRNCFVFCKFISQRYSFSLKKPFAKTVLVEFAK